MLRDACAFVMVLGLAPCAFAQSNEPAVAADVTPTIVLPAAIEIAPAAVPAPVIASQFTPKRPGVLVPMYVGFAALQVMDLHSTNRALSSGAGRELNPVMAGIVGNRAAAMAVKAASTAGTIWLGEKLWKKHPAAAIVLMTAVNGFMTAVVAHNYSVH